MSADSGRVVARTVDSALRCETCGERCTSGLALREHTIREHEAPPAEPTGELLRQQTALLLKNWINSPDQRYRAADALLSGPLAPLLAKLRDAEAREAIARIEGCAGALNAAVHEVDDDEDAQLLARRAIQWEQEADALRRALDAS